MILDYSEYKTESAERGIVNYRLVENNTILFAHKPYCPFCNREINNEVYSKSRTSYPGWLSGDFWESEIVIQCPICGWWEYQYKNRSDAIGDGIRAEDFKYSTAILKQFTDDSIDVPVDELRRYLLKKPEIIYNIDPHKMEDLVRSVFRDFYPNCTVTACGKTRDGGKDAILINSEGKHYFVSVKRRGNPDATEGVGTIRDLLGAAIANDGITGCIYVTTADHFSSDAKTLLNKVVTSSSSLIDTYDLYDFNSFIQAINKSASKLPENWRDLLHFK